MAVEVQCIAPAGHMIVPHAAPDVRADLVVDDRQRGLRLVDAVCQGQLSDAAL
jgi:hypothetical protein